MTPTRHLWRTRIEDGERCVRFEFVYSVILATIRCPSRVYLTSSRLDRYIRGLPYAILTVLLGPWGIPWGPIFTARAIWVNLTGGEDVTAEVLNSLVESDPA